MAAGGVSDQIPAVTEWHKVTDQLMPAMAAMAMKMSKISLRGAWGRRGLQRRVQTFAALDSEMHGIFRESSENLIESIDCYCAHCYPS